MERGLVWWRTVPNVHETGADRLPDAKMRMNAALLAAMDCGSSSTVRIRRSVLRDLLDILVGHPLTPADPVDRRAKLTIRPDASARVP